VKLLNAITKKLIATDQKARGSGSRPCLVASTRAGKLLSTELGDVPLINPHGEQLWSNLRDVSSY
jgi:hypothetical protein